MRFYNAIDIEAYHKEIFVPFCLCINYENKAIIFYGENVVNKMLQWCDLNKIHNTFYAHNLTFDGGLILAHADSTIYTISGFYFRASIYELTIKSPRFKIIIKCSYKMLPLSLKKIGNLIESLEKLEFDHKKVDEKSINNLEIKNEIIKYCIRDTKIVSELIKRIEKGNNWMAKSMDASKSISSLALRIFKTNYNIYKLNTSISVEDDMLIRPAYYGGRCEVFGNAIQGEKIFHFDFTGMYSKIMLESFCFGEMKIIEKVANVSEKGFYKVEVYSNNMLIPILPYRDTKSKKLLFPNGRWVGIYWWEELKYFEEAGGKIEKIYFMIKLEKEEQILKSFIEDHARLRIKGAFENIFWKLFINSISGRLGMGADIETTEIINSEENYKKIRESKKIIREKRINHIRLITYEKEIKPEKIRSNVCISAIITSKARIKLHRAYKAVIENDGRILYSDTDSIFAAYKRNVINEKHGEIHWDSQKKDTIIESAIFAVPKGYALKINNKEIVKLKGFTQNSISFNEFKTCFENNEKITKKEEIFKKDKIIPYIISIEKSTKISTYDKRKFNNTKTDTTALEINE